MNYQVKHACRGRVRLRMAQPRMTVEQADQLEAYLAEHPASVGILTVPHHAASSMAGRLVACGVRGIWNFTNTELDISRSDVRVESVHFSDSLLTLSYLITEEV